MMRGGRGSTGWKEMESAELGKEKKKSCVRMPKRKEKDDVSFSGFGHGLTTVFYRFSSHFLSYLSTATHPVTAVTLRRNVTDTRESLFQFYARSSVCVCTKREKKERDGVRDK